MKKMPCASSGIGRGRPFGSKFALKKTVLIIVLVCIGISILWGTQVKIPSSRLMARVIATGNINALKILEVFPGVVKARDSDGRTPLHYCGERPEIQSLFSIWTGEKGGEQGNKKWLKNSKRMAELLISHGADVNAKDVFSLTPLHYAARAGNIEVAKVLLASGADVSAKERSYSTTALHLAVLESNIPMAKFLIENGAEVNAKDYFGTPLIQAVGTRDYIGTPFAQAIENHRGMVDLLLNNKADVEMKNRDGFAPMHLAGDIETAQLLLSHGAKLDTKGYEGRTPLHQSAMRNWNDMVEWFCSKGANVNALDSKGQTPVITALSQQGYNIDLKTRTETVRILLKYGADASCRDEKGWTLLHYAVRENGEDLADLLLKRGVYINAKDKYGYTPLHWAVTNRSKEMVELLVSRGADVNARDLQGNTPLHETWGGSYEEVQIADILKSRGGTR